MLEVEVARETGIEEVVVDAWVRDEEDDEEEEEEEEEEEDEGEEGLKKA